MSRESLSMSLTGNFAQHQRWPGAFASLRIPSRELWIAQIQWNCTNTIIRTGCCKTQTAFNVLVRVYISRSGSRRGRWSSLIAMVPDFSRDCLSPWSCAQLSMKSINWECIFCPVDSQVIFSLLSKIISCPWRGQCSVNRDVICMILSRPNGDQWGQVHIGYARLGQRFERVITR